MKISISNVVLLLWFEIYICFCQQWLRRINKTHYYCSFILLLDQLTISGVWTPMIMDFFASVSDPELVLLSSFVFINFAGFPVQVWRLDPFLGSYVAMLVMIFTSFHLG